LTSFWTGLAIGNGSKLEVEVSKLGAIIASVTTHGLKGTIPVFVNTTKILA
jgi:hypothetical protein